MLFTASMPPPPVCQTRKPSAGGHSFYCDTRSTIATNAVVIVQILLCQTFVGGTLIMCVALDFFLLFLYCRFQIWTTKCFKQLPGAHFVQYVNSECLCHSHGYINGYFCDYGHARRCHFFPQIANLRPLNCRIVFDLHIFKAFSLAPSCIQNVYQI